MEQFTIEISLISEAIFGNGESSTSLVDIEILKDEIGIPYLRGKTLKGKLREEIVELEKILFNDDKLSYELSNSLFGKEGEYEASTLKFTDCKISKDIDNNIRYSLENGDINKDEITEAFTEIRNFTKIDNNGVAEKGTLRQARVIRKGIKLYCDVICQRELSKEEKSILAYGIATLRNLGMMESRGKGQVICRLLANTSSNNTKVDVTEEYMNYIKDNEEVVR